MEQLTNMTSLHERLKLKQYQVDAWTTREQLCLASAVLRSGSGDQNWIAVSRTIKALTTEHDRPLDWYSTKNCALQYAKLLEQVEIPKRKRERNELPVNESPGEIVTKMLSKQRVEELKGILEEERATYNQLYKEVKLLESNIMDDRLHQMWDETMREQDLEDEEEERRQIWLKEREEKMNAIQLALNSPIKETSPQKRKSTDSVSPVLEDQKPVVEQPMMLEEEIKLQDVEMDNQISNSSSSNEDSNSKSTIVDSDITSETLSAENQTMAQVSEFCFMKQEEIADETPIISTEPETNVDIKKEEDDKTTDPSTPVPKVEHNPYLFTDDDSELTSCVYVSEKLSKAKMEKVEFKCEEKKINKVLAKLDTEPDKDKSPVKVAPSDDATVKLFKADEVYTYHDEPEEKQTKRDYTRRRDFHKEDPFKLITETKRLSELENSLLKLEKSKLESGGTATDSVQDQKKNDVANSISSETLLEIPGVSEGVKTEEGGLCFDIGGKPSWLKDEEGMVKEEEENKSVKRKKKAFFQKKEDVKEETKLEEKELPKVEEDKKDVGSNLESGEKDEKGAMDSKFCDTFSSLCSPSGPLTHFDVPIKLLAKNEKREDTKFESDSESIRDDESSSYRGSRNRDDDFEDVSRDSMDLTLRDYSVRSERRKISASESVSSPRVSESTPSSPASTHYGDDFESEKAHRMWKKSIMLLWKEIASHKYSSIFLKPITEDKAPGYHSIILKPMDLFKVKRHIDSGQIRTLAEFHRDILLMFLNAKMYNASDHNVHIMSTEMLADTVASLEEHVRAAQVGVNAPAETTVTPKTLRRDMRESSAKLTGDRKRKREDTSGDEKRRKN